MMLKLKQFWSNGCAFYMEDDDTTVIVYDALQNEEARITFDHNMECAVASFRGPMVGRYFALLG